MKKEMKVVSLKSAPESEVIKWLNTVVPKIMEVYGLGKITVYYRLPKESKMLDGEGEAAFDINYQKAYRSAYINVYPIAETMFKNRQLKTLSSAITHEIAHIITGPFTDIALDRYISKRELQDGCEELTESVAQIGRQLVQKIYPDLFKIEGPVKKKGKKL